VLSSAAIERVENIDGLSHDVRCGLRVVVAVFKSNFVNQRFGQYRGLSYLKFGVPRNIVGGSIRQRCGAARKPIGSLLMLDLIIHVQRVVLVYRELAASVAASGAGR